MLLKHVRATLQHTHPDHAASVSPAKRGLHSPVTNVVPFRERMGERTIGGGFRCWQFYKGFRKVGGIL